MNSSKLKHHWSESGGLSTIKLAQVFKKLAETKRVYNNFAVVDEPDNTIMEYHNPDITLILWNYGYLTIKSYHDGFYELNSPNQETLKALNYIKMAILQSKVEIQEKYIEANLIRNLLRDKIEEFAKNLCIYCYIKSFSKKINNEAEFQQCFVEIFRNEYRNKINSQRSFAKEKLDAIFTDRNRPYSIELKYNKSAKQD